MKPPDVCAFCSLRHAPGDCELEGETSNNRVPLDHGRGEVVVNRERGRLDVTIGGVTVTAAASTPLELSDLINAMSAGGRWLWGEEWQEHAWKAEADPDGGAL